MGDRSAVSSTNRWRERVVALLLIAIIWFLWRLFSGRDINPFDVTIVYGRF